jgi:type IV pilus assembly protein PilQ
MRLNGIRTSFRHGRSPRETLATFVVTLIFFTVPTVAQETALDRLIQRTRSGRSSAASASPKADTETLESAAASNGDAVRGGKLDTTSVEPAKRVSKESQESPGPNVRTPTSNPKIPLASPKQSAKIKIDPQDELISIVARDAPLSEVLELLAHEKRLNLITTENIKANISINLNRVQLAHALDTILSVAGYTWVRENDIIVVTSLTGASKLAPQTQGRVIRVFRLDYASAKDVSTAITGFLSPAGQSFVSQTTLQDNRKTQDVVVVEDIPAVVERVAQYVAQVDVAPRQVLVEARVLQVTLRDNYVNGVNILFDELSRRGFGEELRIDMQANPLASPAFLFTFSRKDLNLLVELLETTTDAKNLASPKVLVVNGQEAYFQVGQRLGYKMVTTTETSSQESVAFLDVGVQLRVRPYISGDNNVLMHVKPEVSSGRINPLTGVPDAEITHVETDVLSPTGEAWSSAA